MVAGVKQCLTVLVNSFEDNMSQSKLTVFLVTPGLTLEHSQTVYSHFVGGNSSFFCFS